MSVWIALSGLADGGNRVIKARHLGCAALALTASLAAAPSEAQTAQMGSIDVCVSATCASAQQAGQIGAVSAFGNLLSTSGGRALLDANMAAVEAIYATSTPHEKSIAVPNSEDIFDPPAISDHIWKMVPTETGAVMAALSEVELLPQSVVDLLDVPLSGTLQIGAIKDYYSTANIYGRAYGLLPGHPGAALDPRPYLTSAAIADMPWSKIAGLPAHLAENQQEQWQENEAQPAFQSGHTTAGYTTALLYAVLLPEQYQPLMTAAQDFGLSRNVLGLHYPTDVIGGRIVATYDMVQLLSNNPSYSPNFGDAIAGASADLHAALGAAVATPFASCSGSVANAASCVAAGAFPDASSLAAANAAHIAAITYGLPSVGPTTDAPIVPLNAETLIATRFPYLSGEQRRDVLASTELPSGVPLDDHATGWARLNLYAAAGGYGSFETDVSVTMDASRGGFNAIDFWGNDIDGPGGLIKAGSGTLVLGGTNSYQGGTTVTGGVLALSGTLGGDLAIGASGAFVDGGGYQVNPGATMINEGIFVSVGGPLVNLGTLANGGMLAGGVVNAGSMANAAGGTVIGNVVSSGSLLNDGLIAGSVTNTGRLAGTGTMAALSNSGVVAPGTPGGLGSLSVSGTAGFTAGSVYEAGIGASGQSDRIFVGGAATLGGALELVAAPGAIDAPGSYTVLVAGGGITGSFSSVNDPFGSVYPFLDIAVETTPTTVIASAVPDIATLTSGWGTENQNAVAAALADHPEADRLLTAASVLDFQTAGLAFDQLSGQIYPATLTVMQNRSATLRGAIGDRLRQADDALGIGAGPATAALAPGLEPSVWMQGYGYWGDTDASANTAELTQDTGGFVVGADAEVTDSLRLGLAGGYGSTDYAQPALGASASMTSWDLAVYAGAGLGPLALRFGGAYGWQDISTSRTVTMASFSDALSSDADGGTGQLFAEVSHELAVGVARVEPFAGLAYVTADLDGAGESGGAAALAIESGSLSNTYSTLGLRVAAPLPILSEALSLRGGLGWRYAFGTVSTVSTLAFAAGGDAFTVVGPAIGRNTALLDLGASYRFGQAVAADISYSGAFAENGQSNGLNGLLSVRF